MNGMPMLLSEYILALNSEPAVFDCNVQRFQITQFFFLNDLGVVQNKILFYVIIIKEETILFTITTYSEMHKFNI